MEALVDTATTRRLFYRVANRSIAVTALDDWSARLVEKIFADWYVAPENEKRADLPASKIRIRSRVEPPPLPATDDHFEITDGGVCHSKGPASYIEIDGSLVITGVPGLADAEVWIHPSSEDNFPRLIRVISYALSSALRRCALFELHSAAVIEPASGEGVLIVGPSGSGKSTLTIQLSADGWLYLSDDVLTLSAGDNEVTAWPLRRSFAVTQNTVAASEFLQARTSLSPVGNYEKARFTPQEVFHSEFRESCTPRTLFFSQVTHAAQSKVSKLTKAEAMARLIRMSPWSCYDKGTASAHLAALNRLVKQSRAYDLAAGRDLLVPDLASAILTPCVRD